MKLLPRHILSLTALAIAACQPLTGNDDKDGGTSSTNDGGGSTNDDGGGGSGGGGGGGGGADFLNKAFHKVVLPDETERVTGVYCSAPGKCAVTTGRPANAGHLYATDGKTILGAALLTGNEAYAQKAAPTVGLQGGTAFMGFARAGDRVLLVHSSVEAIYTSALATGDVTQAASWSTSAIGVPSAGGFGLNKQYGFGSDGKRSLMIAHYRVWETTDVPGPAAGWTEIWAPGGSPEIPTGHRARRDAERRQGNTTLCNTDPGATAELNQHIYTAPDLGLIVMPADAASGRGDDKPGVCISVDGGKEFRHVEFPGRAGEDGPYGVECTSKDHCVAYAGKDLGSNDAAIWYTDDASKGATSTWTKATTPALADYTTFRHVAFADDGKHGYITGWPRDPKPLLFQTTDGGKTWTDATAKIRALAPDVRLHMVYITGGTAFVGGDKTLLATD